MKFSSNKDVEQICVVGDSIPQPIALVVLSVSARKKTKLEILASLDKTLQHVNSQLDSHERLHNIVVVSEEWTVENKLLTPTMKIKRNAIEKLYKDKYIMWYETKSDLSSSIIIDA